MTISIIAEEIQINRKTMEISFSYERTGSGCRVHLEKTGSDEEFSCTNDSCEGTCVLKETVNGDVTSYRCDCE